MSTLQPTLDDIWQLFKESDLKFWGMVEERRWESSETDRKIKEGSESIDRLGNKLGDFVEGMVWPAAVRLFRERGIDVHEVHQNVNPQRGEDAVEIDLLMVDDVDVIAVECKSTLSVDDVNEHLARLAKVKRLLPAYADKRVMGAAAAGRCGALCRLGLFVIAQTGDHLPVRNDAAFRPGVW
jgi:hypothetical protein